MRIFIRALEHIGMCKLIPFNCSKGFWSTAGQKRSIQRAAGGQTKDVQGRKEAEENLV